MVVFLSLIRLGCLYVFFFFKQKTAYEMRISDWSSDVCSSDLAKTVADCFRHRSKIGLSVAIEGLQEALRQRKTTPAEIARQAERGGVSTVIRPYLEALTANG